MEEGEVSAVTDVIDEREVGEGRDVSYVGADEL